MSRLRASVRRRQATAPPPAPTAESGFGIAAAPGDFFAKNAGQIDAILADYEYIGLTWGRWHFEWDQVQAIQGGPYNWPAEYDLRMQRFAAAGIRPMICIGGGTPPWARSGTCDFSPGWETVCPPLLDMDGFAAFCGAAAARYASYDPVWEIWNEPNIEAFWRPHPNPGQYTTLLKKSYTAIKAADPTATVISAGLTLGWDNADTDNPVSFLSNMYANGAKGFFDGVGWHPYQWHNIGQPAYMPGGVDGTQPWYQMYGTNPSARSLMTANGDGAKKIWVTEYGTHTSFQDMVSGTETEQAAMFEQAVELWSSYDWAAAFMFYTYMDSQVYGASGTNEAYFGFWRVNHSQKPAVQSTKNAIAALAL